MQSTAEARLYPLPCVAASCAVRAAELDHGARGPRESLGQSFNRLARQPRELCLLQHADHGVLEQLSEVVQVLTDEGGDAQVK